MHIGVTAALVMVAMIGIGCSGGGGGGSTGGGTGGGTVTMTGPYSYSGPATPTAFTVSAGSNTELTINMKLADDIVGVTALLPNAPDIDTRVYATSDFGQFGLGVSEPDGTDMATDSTDTISLTVTSLGDNNSGEQSIHGSVSIGYHGTQAYPDGGQASGAGTFDATF